MRSNRLDLQIVVQPLHKVHVTAAEVCHRQDADNQLAIVTCSGDKTAATGVVVVVVTACNHPPPLHLQDMRS